MAGATSLIIGGALAAGAGGMMQGRAQMSAADRAAKAAEFNPWNITGAGGSVRYNPFTRGLRVSPDQQMALFQNLFGNQAAQQLAGNGYNSFAQGYAQQAGSQALEQAFPGALAASDPTSAINAGNMFSNFSAGNALFGQNAGMNALALANNFGQSQTGINEAQAQNLFNLGFGALGNTDFSQLASDQLARQRAFARPAEDRAVASSLTNLFNRGVLSSTSGERQMGELALGQELADIQRVNAAESFANMLREQNRGFGLSAIGQGLGARQMDQSFNLGAANLFGGMGQNLLAFGQGAGQTAFNTQLGLNELINTRGQQRLMNAQGLLGFGSALQNQGANQALGYFGALRGINADLRNLMALSANVGSEDALAGYRQGGFITEGGISPFGALLGGFGQGLMMGGAG